MNGHPSARMAASYDFPQDLTDAQDKLHRVRADLQTLFRRVPWSVELLDAWERHENAWRPSSSRPASPGWEPQDAAEIARLRAREVELATAIVIGPGGLGGVRGGVVRRVLPCGSAAVGAGVCARTAAGRAAQVGEPMAARLGEDGNRQALAHFTPPGPRRRHRHRHRPAAARSASAADHGRAAADARPGHPCRRGRRIRRTPPRLPPQRPAGPGAGQDAIRPRPAQGCPTPAAAHPGPAAPARNEDANHPTTASNRLKIKLARRAPSRWPLLIAG